MTSLWLDGRPPAQTDVFEVGARYDAVVVGAGLTGMVTALLLARSGMRVAVLEARSLGAVTTGNTTAKLSLLQGTVLSTMRRAVSARVLRAYVEGNREGQGWLLRYLAEHEVPVQRRDAFTYATTAEGAERVARELAACRVAGLDVVETADTGLPYPTSAALRLADQAQFDPLDVLQALARDLRSRGGVLVDGTRVQGVRRGSPAVLATSRGEVAAERVVLATGTPVLDRGLYFAKLAPSRSYALAFQVPGTIPAGMYLSADVPGRSLRTAPVDGAELLLVGGNGHAVGRNPSTRRAVDDLVAWTGRWFPGAELTHRWSAQDYRSLVGVPFVGRLPRGGGQIFLATGYDKWGMTNAVSAALMLSAEILGGHLPWARTLHHRVTKPAALATGVRFNAGVAGTLVRDWLRVESGGSAPAGRPPEGQGVVHRRGLRPVGVSTVDGRTCEVSAVCTHLGAVLGWNDAERTWDCPLHGSRFGADGTLLEGPAVRDLRPADPQGAAREPAPGM
ncbi:FAD dependent oxidoreductase [Xylanimonas cellulosilytica DSM 15894]|uniref:FAD dependent oxidoreductase n=1 Tax=Xylanimonas cellulosilytica (strain DSM 15894 / JCM 12276 / CECT 5975 / KCTC 9989 / LMG 20990 / NBRC 107835 / XIL07) TaxID=446471 RepID=D1BXZ1_XYLCX|nr:FAD-dependent oxidoreductase [Xylanimonas cellulosilytica]ACZ31782.1 FAD dependent oxidoreductase [Xylanimonas cellulosilytica DSM 15894]